MKIDTAKTMKPIRKIRKLLKDFPAEARADDVHDLRTNCRKLEAIAQGVAPDRKQAKGIVKAIQPLRKAAGHVRDLDVLIGNAMQLVDEVPIAALTELVERMGERRALNATKLHKFVRKHADAVRSELKEFRRALEEQAEKDANEESPAGVQVTAVQLDHWPKLHAENLHEFRIQTKQLRYMLQLCPETESGELEALTKVKDTAGEWHDWLELEQMARDILGQDADKKLLVTLRQRRREKLRTALTAANSLRKKGFGRLLHV